MLSSATSAFGTPASAAASRATCSHISSGSGAPAFPTSSGCQVCAATPMMHGVRGSIATVTRPPSFGLPSLPLPLGLALLRERPRTFLRVLGLEDRARDAALLLERGAQLLAEPRQHLDAR